MAKGNVKGTGDPSTNYDWQFNMLDQLVLIKEAIQTQSGVDYEFRITSYKASRVGTGYAVGDFISRTDIVNVATGAIISTVWFNETTGLAIAAPPITDLDPYIPPSAVTVSNLPASLGQKTKAGSLAITLASDEDLLAYLGIVTETAPANDTASSGLNGRLQRIAQRLTTLIAFFRLGQGTMAQSLAVTIASNQSSIPVAGDIAHDAVDSGNPVKIGGKAATSDPTAVADADRVNQLFDKIGRLVMAPHALPENLVSGDTAAITGTAGTDVIAAQGAGIFIYVTSLLVTNSHATVGTVVSLQDDVGSAIPGGKGYAAPAGGGYSIAFSPPLKMPVANKKLQAICGTTGSNVYVSISGFKGV